MTLLKNLILEETSAEDVENTLSDDLRVYDAKILEKHHDKIFFLFNDSTNRRSFIDMFNLILNDEYLIEDDEFDDSNPYALKRRAFPRYYLTLKKSAFDKVASGDIVA